MSPHTTVAPRATILLPFVAVLGACTVVVDVEGPGWVGSRLDATSGQRLSTTCSQEDGNGSCSSVVYQPGTYRMTPIPDANHVFTGWEGCDVDNSANGWSSHTEPSGACVGSVTQGWLDLAQTQSEANRTHHFTATFAPLGTAPDGVSGFELLVQWCADVHAGLDADPAALCSNTTVERQDDVYFADWSAGSLLADKYAEWLDSGIELHSDIHPTGRVRLQNRWMASQPQMYKNQSMVTYQPDLDWYYRESNGHSIMNTLYSVAYYDLPGSHLHLGSDETIRPTMDLGMCLSEFTWNGFVMFEDCDGSSNQRWSVAADGQIRSNRDMCLAISGAYDPSMGFVLGTYPHDGYPDCPRFDVLR